MSGWLQIRFNELYEVVDYFVLVECRVTHQNRPKPLHYEESLERFSRFRDKVIHIALDSLEGHSSYYRSGGVISCAAPVPPACKNNEAELTMRLSCREWDHREHLFKVRSKDCIIARSMHW